MRSLYAFVFLLSSNILYIIMFVLLFGVSDGGKKSIGLISEMSWFASFCKLSSDQNNLNLLSSKKIDIKSARTMYNDIIKTETNRYNSIQSNLLNIIDETEDVQKPKETKPEPISSPVG